VCISVNSYKSLWGSNQTDFYAKGFEMNNMRLLITGGAGFIGSAVVRLAISKGYDVINLDALAYAASLSNLDLVSESENYTFICCNICDKETLNAIFSEHRPDAILHLAAETHVDRSIDAPSAFVETNIVGTYNLVDAALQYWTTQGRPESFRFHHVSTDEVFGSLPTDPVKKFTEETPYAPRSPYAASKASSDHLVRAWYETYGLPTVISNCSNNYGPYQFPEKLIPLMILNAIAWKPLTIYGDGGNVRDWLYVDDHADALLTILQAGEVGRSYNIGGNSEFTNLEIVSKLCALLDRLLPSDEGHYSQLISFVKDRPGHDQRYAIDPSRVEAELHWKPRFSIDAGLEKTVKWYLANDDWWKPLISRAEFGERLGSYG